MLKPKFVAVGPDDDDLWVVDMETERYVSPGQTEKSVIQVLNTLSEEDARHAVSELQLASDTIAHTLSNYTDFQAEDLVEIPYHF